MTNATVNRVAPAARRTKSWFDVRVSFDRAFCLGHRLLMPAGIAVALSAGTLPASVPAVAGETCSHDMMGRPICTAGIMSNNLVHVPAYQKMSEWCWAASISMLFKYHGYSVSQERIVQQRYGTIANVPAMNGQTITDSLSRDWSTDDGAMRFRSSAEAFDLQAGTLDVSNTDIVEELRNDRPLIVGAQGHAMMLTAVTYYPTPMGPQIVGATVRDPWPYNSPAWAEGRRELTMPELQPTYVAKVSVEKISSGASSHSGGQPSDGGFPDVPGVLGKILRASAGGYRTLRGTSSDVVDGIKVWDATVSLGNEPCSVWEKDKDDDGKPYVSCALYSGKDMSSAGAEFDRGKDLIDDAAGSGWSLDMVRDEPATKLYVAKRAGYPKLTVSLRSYASTGRYIVRLTVIGP